MKCVFRRGKVEQMLSFAASLHTGRTHETQLLCPTHISLEEFQLLSSTMILLPSSWILHRRIILFEFLDVWRLTQLHAALDRSAGAIRDNSWSSKSAPIFCCALRIHELSFSPIDLNLDSWKWIWPTYQMG